jgi:hypothetical protein
MPKQFGTVVVTGCIVKEGFDGCATPAYEACMRMCSALGIAQP